MQIADPPAVHGAAPVIDAGAAAFDLRTLKSTCAGGHADDIVVCGVRPAGDRYRIVPIEGRDFGPTQLKAEIGVIGNVKAAAETEAVTLGSGLTSNRVMFRLKLPF